MPPTQKKLEKLWKYCEKFIKDQQIDSGETVYQMDNVIENAYEFVDGVCKIVGYHKHEEDGT